MLTAVCFVLLFAVFAMLYLESLWSNAITLVNVTLAALLALSFFEPAAAYLDSQAPSYTYLWDFLMLWALFCIFFSILRLCTDLASRTRVRFRPPIEIPGRLIFALLVGVVMLAFTLTTFHVAPLPAAPFGGGFGKAPTDATFLMFKPDQTLLGYLQNVSRGSLSRGAVPGFESNQPGDEGKNVFDPSADFVFKYRQRRRDLEAEPRDGLDGLRVGQ